MMQTQAWSPGPSSPTPLTGFTVNPMNRNDVLSFYQHVYQSSENYDSVMAWTGSHSSCSAGTVSSTFVDHVRRRVNYYRAMAGLNADITMNTAATVQTESDPYIAAASTTKTAAAQSAALLISRTGTLTHNPSTSSACFTNIAGNGSYFGNIAIGTYGPGAIDAYMEEDENNLDVGHRRWILYTQATNFATGDVPTVQGYNPSNTLYVRQRSTELAAYTAKFIPWPNAGFCPWQHSTAHWSLSYPGADFSSATVSVSKNGVAQTVTNIQANQGYGNNAVVWQVAGVPNSGSDTTYQVTVSGIGGTNVPTSHSYSITFFDPNVLLDSPTISGSNSIPTTGGSYAVSGVNIAEEYQLEVGKKTTASWTDGAEDATPQLITEGPITGYTQRQTAVKRSGSKAFRLSYMNAGNTLQWIEWDRVILPKSNASIQYYLRRGFMLPTTTFAIQYSLNDGGSWTDVPGSAIVGTSTNNVTESVFVSKTHTFPAETANKPTRLRMVYRKPSNAGEFIASQHAEVGAFVDDMSVTNCEWMSKRTLTLLPATTTSFDLNATTAGEALIDGSSYTLRIQPRIASKWMTASPMVNVSVGTVTPVNNAPTLDLISNPAAILENASKQVISLTGITAGEGETQEVKITATSSNTALIPHPTVNYTSPSSTGSLSYQPVANASGTAIITVTVNDGQGSNPTITRTFTVTVTNVNNAPVITGLENVTLDEDTSTALLPLTIVDPDTAAASIKTTITSSNAVLIPVKSVVIAGTTNSRTLKITPALNRSGTAEITFTTTDKLATSVQKITVTVREVNDAPVMKTVFKALAVNEDTVIKPIAFSGVSAGINETQALSITAVSSNPAVIPHPSVIYTSPGVAGSLVLTSAANATGSATITFTINDGGAVNATLVRTFVVTVNPVNDAPSISVIPAKLVTKNTSSAPILFTVSDPESAPNLLTVSAISSNAKLLPVTNIVFGGSGANRQLIATPLPNVTGTATITVSVKDEKLIAKSVFVITVANDNTAPIISEIQDVAIDAGQTMEPLEFFVNDPEDKIAQLVLSVDSSNPALVPNANVTIAGTGTNRTLSITPVAGQYGSTTITVTVNDGGAINSTASNSFTFTVNNPFSPNLKADITSYETWVQQRYPDLAEDGFAGDFDDDGLSNGAEYALDLDPTTTSPQGNPSSDAVSGKISLTTDLSAKKTDVVYAAEFSADGETWSSEGVTVEHANNKLTATVSATSGTIRWHITRAVD